MWTCFALQVERRREGVGKITAVWLEVRSVAAVASPLGYVGGREVHVERIGDARIYTRLCDR
jgi:hypothetical protein